MSTGAIILFMFFNCVVAFAVGHKIGKRKGIRFAKESRKRAIDMLFPPIKNKE